MCTRENEMKWTVGHNKVIGIDEAGAGCLAGPVTVCACYLPVTVEIKGINDSKKLSAKKRELIYKQLTTNPKVMYELVHIDNQTIDKINILQSRFLGMFISYEKLKLIIPDIDCVLIDGNQIPPQFNSELTKTVSKIESELTKTETNPIVVKTIIGGDGICPSIAAASIIAKVTRDHMMCNEYNLLYPGYGFDKHKGYGTSEHISAIKQLKPCPIHRLTFKQVS